MQHEGQFLHVNKVVALLKKKKEGGLQMLGLAKKPKFLRLAGPVQRALLDQASGPPGPASYDTQRPTSGPGGPANRA